MENIEKILKDDAREKSRARPKLTTSVKRPKKINMPGDRIDKRKNPDYRAGSVETYNIHGSDFVVKLHLKDLPTWRQFRMIRDRERQREILKPYCEQYEDIEISNAMKAPEHGFKRYRSDLGIFRQEPRNPEKYEKEGIEIIIVGQPETAGEFGVPREKVNNKKETKKDKGLTFSMPENGFVKGMRFSLGGSYTPGELQKKLLALAGMFEEGLFDNNKYNIQLFVTESEEEENKENGKDDVNVEQVNSDRQVST